MLLVLEQRKINSKRKKALLDKRKKTIIIVNILRGFVIAKQCQECKYILSSNISHNVNEESCMSFHFCRLREVNELY